MTRDEATLRDVVRECTISAEGKMALCDADIINPKLATGMVETKIDTLVVLGKVIKLFPFEVPNSTDTREDI